MAKKTFLFRIRPEGSYARRFELQQAGNSQRYRDLGVVRYQGWIDPANPFEVRVRGVQPTGFKNFRQAFKAAFKSMWEEEIDDGTR